MGYFEYSQEVKRQIVEELSLGIRFATQSFTRGLTVIASGNSTTVYMIGQLESGLWVAARKLIRYSDVFSTNRYYFRIGVRFY